MSSRTHTKQKILICFSSSESWTILKNQLSFFFPHTRLQRGTQLNICRWAFMFEGWSEYQTAQSQINNNFHKYLEHNSPIPQDSPRINQSTIKSLFPNFTYQQFKQPSNQTAKFNCVITDILFCIRAPSIPILSLFSFLFVFSPQFCSQQLHVVSYISF